MAGRSLPLGAAVLVALGAAAPAAGARPIPANIKIVGASCTKALEVELANTGPAGAVERFPQHADDDTFIDAAGTKADLPGGRRHYEVRWSLGPDVVLCSGSWTRLGFGADQPITAPTGTLAKDLGAAEPAQAKVKARFRKEIELRDDLTKARLRTLVVGWTTRSCELKATNPAAAAVVASLAERAGAHGCTPPKRLRPTSEQLLHHLVARFNDAGPKGGTKMAHEYYRVLGQLTTY